MNLALVQKLKELASEADILHHPNVQTILHAIALDDDMEMALDAQELFAMKALKKITSPDPFEQLPEGDEVAGDIEFGKVGNKDNSFGLLFKEMTQHAFLAGRSGSGKTTLLYHVLNQLLEEKIPFIVFDHFQIGCL